MRKLWYRKPACVWEEALPIGNGRIGGMVFSDPICDRIALNEDTLWSGSVHREERQHKLEELEPIRDAVSRGRYAEATRLTEQTMFGVTSQAYLPLGELRVEVVGTGTRVGNYSRTLTLADGLVRTEYDLDGVHFCREAFVSIPEDILVLHVHCSEKRDFHVSQSVSLQHRKEGSNGIISVCGRCPSHVSSYDRTMDYSGESIFFSCLTFAQSDGIVVGEGGDLWIFRAKELTLLFSVATSFRRFDLAPTADAEKRCGALLNAARRFSYLQLRERHCNAFGERFGRVQLDLGPGKDAPTEERLAHPDGDEELAALLFDYGRYLMIASSLPGTQPANLQGIWNDRLLPSWNCNYTMNINAPMNYWPAEVCGLGDCHLPFLELVRDLSLRGNRFGCRGWMSWHNTDLWRFNCEANGEALWGYWPMGGFWAARHIWEHYDYTRDLAFLREYFPVLQGAVDFLEDWMIPDSEGKLTTCPSTSPENEFWSEGVKCSVCRGSAMDLEIAWDLLDKTARAADALGVGSDRFRSLRDRIVPLRVGEDGRLLEWGESFPAVEKGHRHLSPLYGVFPSDQITPEHPAWDGAQKLLASRLESGSGVQGWSNAWIAMLHARFGEGDAAHARITEMLRCSVYPSLLDKHPPFQIDGNFGICAVICELLLQSHRGKVTLLPALPSAWSSGSFRGLRARGGYSVDADWEEGRLTYSRITPLF